MYSAVWESARHGNAGKGQLVFRIFDSPLSAGNIFDTPLSAGNL